MRHMRHDSQRWPHAALHTVACGKPRAIDVNRSRGL